MKRCAIFAHYDAQNEVKRYVVHHVKSLREHADEVIFVSTARLDERELDKVRPFCSAVFVKENVGFDFGMWQEALERVDLDAWDELVLTNSAIFGPVTPLGPVFEAMTRAPCDFWGMTGNFEYAWHIQSYFVAFKRPILQSEAFRKFWRSVLPYRDKWQVIRSYEIGLTSFLQENGFVARPFVELEPRPRFRLRRLLARSHRDPMYHHPVELIERGMPYVKVEIFRTNPSKIRIAPLRRAIERAGYDPALLEFDLR